LRNSISIECAGMADKIVIRPVAKNGCAAR